MTDLLWLDAGAVAAALPLATLIEALPAALARSEAAPLRVRADGRGGRELLAMPALSADHAGVKLLTIVPDNAARGLPTIRGLFLLFDMADGAPVASLDAQELTARRTAAVSALAARALARDDAATLALLGAGHLIPYLAEAHADVRPIRSIRLWARDPAKAEATRAAIARRLPAAEVRIVPDLAEAIGGADIVSAATRATLPLIRGEWIAPGTHLDLVGGYRPDMREIDDRGIAAARIFVDTRDGALAEAGDLIDPIARGLIAADAIRGDLAALLAGDGRRSRDEITLFKSVGTAAVDLAAAELAWRAHRSPVPA